jgi:outer membrane lipoprotein-sorting protein
LLISACGDKRPLAEQLASNTEEGLAKVQTVQGRMDISTGPVTLQQKLWVQRPNFLRTETEEGPAQFKRTIVVLNDKDGWFYNPALRLVTVTDRSKYDPTLAAEAGTGSMLERMPTEILALLRTNPSIHEVGGEEIADRDTIHIEIVINGQTKAFPNGPLQLWLDKEFGYPLAVMTSSGLKIRFTMVEFNRTIDPLTFIFVPPPGALVQRVNPQTP